MTPSDNTNSENTHPLLAAVIGSPVAQSLSPQMHNAGYAALGIVARYVALDIPPDELTLQVNQLFDHGLKGLSITIPHKMAAMALADDLTPEAQAIGAINTLYVDSGRRIGTNTDWLGARQMIEEVAPIAGKAIAILGTGGTARAVHYALRQSGAKAIFLLGRRIEKIDWAQDGVTQLLPLNLAAEVVPQSDIIINTTPVGMAPNDGSPIATELIQPGQIVADVVYHPRQTRLLREARARSASVITGDRMLLWQGAAQFELFTGNPAPIAAMEKSLLQALNQEARS